MRCCTALFPGSIDPTSTAAQRCRTGRCSRRIGVGEARPQERRRGRARRHQNERAIRSTDHPPKPADGRLIFGSRREGAACLLSQPAAEPSWKTASPYPTCHSRAADPVSLYLARLFSGRVFREAGVRMEGGRRKASRGRSPCSAWHGTHGGRCGAAVPPPPVLTAVVRS